MRGIPPLRYNMELVHENSSDWNPSLCQRNKQMSRKLILLGTLNQLRVNESSENNDPPPFLKNILLKK